MSLSYLSTLQIESKLVPGVTYHLHKMSHGRRMAINEQTAPVYAEISDLQREMEPLNEDIRQAEEDAKIEPCTCKHDAESTHDEKTGRCQRAGCLCRKPQPTIADAYLRRGRLEERETTIVLAKIWPIRLRALVASIDGFPIDGTPATVESLLAEAPEPMIGELAREVNRLFNMGHDEQLAFLLPGTSGVAVAGQTKDTNAPIVSGTGSTPSGTV